MGFQQQQQAQQTTKALKLVGDEISSLRKLQEDDKTMSGGPLGHLRGNARWLAYLARGCDSFDVALCASRLGRDLFDDLRRAGDVGQSPMQQIGFPVVMTNRVAYGLPAATWGGRSAEHAPEWALTAADFRWTSQEALDAWIPPHDVKRQKLETRD